MKKFKDFDNFGIMLPVAYKASMSLDSMKNFFRIIRKMGYNQVFLYTEDKMEVLDEPYHGYMRGRYSKDELKEMYAYADSIGIELIPCVQTLAHLSGLALWPGHYNIDAEDVLLVDDDRTYTYIERLLITCRECFKTDKIHIGMDEAHHLGLGNHLKKHGYETKISIMTRHLAKVNELCKKHGYENPMIWSDMLFYGWNNDVYVVPKQEIPEPYKSALPKNIIPVFWDYYHCKKKEFSDMLEMHLEISKKTWFAGGVWTWCGTIPDNEWTIKSMIPALDACRENKIKNVFMTLWGNNGGECSFYSVLPSLCYIAEYAKGNTDEEKIKAKFKRIVGLDYEECMRIDFGNYIAGNERNVTHSRNPSKYMLYADTVNDFLDWTVKPGASYKFAEVAKDLHALAKKSRKYGYVYETAARLCDAMEIKYELGLKTRAAYEAKDKDALRKLANEDYVEVVKRIDAYGKAHVAQWKKENKFSGLEALDLRIGGIIRRMQTVRQYILEYCDGKVDCIEPLDQELLPYKDKEKSWVFGGALGCMSANVL